MRWVTGNRWRLFNTKAWFLKALRRFQVMLLILALWISASLCWLLFFSEKAWTALKAAWNTAYLNRFQQQLVIKTQQGSRQLGGWGIKGWEYKHERDSDLWRGAGAVCTERLLWIFPQWRRTGQRQHGQHVRPRAHWQLLAWLWCTISVRQTAFSLSPPPIEHKPVSVFAQPERMLASHYAAHANFVSLQLFNDGSSVFVCFLAIRLLHLYGWSGVCNNPWHLFRVGG